MALQKPSSRPPRSRSFLVLDADLRIERANTAFLRHFRITVDEADGCLVYDLGNGEWNLPVLRRLLQDLLSKEGRVEDYRVEHDFEHIGKRIMLLNASLLRREGASDCILLAISDDTERERLIYQLEGQIEYAHKLIDSVREAILVLHWDLRAHSANQTFYQTFGVRPEETEGRLVYELGNGQWDIPELRKLLGTILPKENAFDDYLVEHEFEKIGRRIMLLNGRRLDHLNLIVLAIRDITDQSLAETRQKALMGELQHRVKNLLNNVRTLASQTRHSARTLDAFFDAFEARLGALARTQDLLVRSPLEPVDLGEIIRVELGAIGAQRGQTYKAQGPAGRLSPRDAQAMHMTVHELTTNAAKYGALAAESGRIEIVWSIKQESGQSHLDFRWKERGVDLKDRNPSKGFGSRVIEETLPYMLGGTAALVYEGDGVACLLRFPLAHAQVEES
jgi:two-component sensor histidine kinase/PAS domain-containing protein